MDGNNTVLSRFFTQYTFTELLKRNHSNIYNTVIKRYNIDPSEKTNGQIISEIYSVMSKSYRNEYYYQNTLLNKLLISGRHNPKTTTALTQIPIGKSKADFILINGKAVVYEIKSDLDSFERLDTQLKDYYKAFDHVCVVTGENNYEKIKSLLKDTPVGFYILTAQNTISRNKRKEPIKDGSSLDYSALFKILHKREFESIISVFGGLPDCPPVHYYKECFEVIKNIPIATLYELFLKELKKRNRIVIDEFKVVPYELKSLIYFFNGLGKSYNILNTFLQNNYGG